MNTLLETIGWLERKGYRRVAVLLNTSHTSGVPVGFKGVLLQVGAGARGHSGVFGPRKERIPLQNCPADVDAIVVADPAFYATAMRLCESLQRKGVVVVPANREALASLKLRGLDAQRAAWETSAAANYVARCNLKGHYLEFGCWYGRSFFNNYHEMKHWLAGDFFAFDSFAGLSAPKPLESEYTGGDFALGSYCCNKETFLLLCEMAEVAKERLRVTEGFYETTLEKPASAYGLADKSVSVCVIDCDLLEPTRQVLEFVTPLLEDGALIYFDDWRLTRASAKVGERAAALEWLAVNRQFELIEFDRTHWQHQWFILGRREPVIENERAQLVVPV
ncbi:class I SAM-dependent methyltransferase [Polycladidibacter hongkongensis]|uniref:class I SAM-dependent methyltransferase n=1 Tax=Polycladidibacter hongkongensis TaxID=1647556 RepID=UPI000833185B|nr:class I SAM-dependent methyltransferase [Pseudovibrio hongkongensis]